MYSTPNHFREKFKIKKNMFVVLLIVLVKSALIADVSNIQMNEKWQTGNQEAEIILSVPPRWKIQPGMARDEKNNKRIEFSIADSYDRSTLRGLKIISRKKYDSEFELVVAEEQNEAETGTGVVKGTVYALHIIYRGKSYQRIAFFDWQGTPSNKKLYLEIIKDIKIHQM
jgi:hypothetical protein